VPLLPSRSGIQRARSSLRQLWLRTRGSPRAPRAWPSPSGPPGRLRARVGPGDAFCGAVCAERLESIFGCPCGWRGRSVQCATFRPGPYDTFTVSGASGVEVTAWPWCWWARQRVAARTAGGRSQGVRCAAARRVRRASVRRTRRKPPPRNDESPGEPWPPTASYPGRSSLSTARARPRCSRPGPSGPARRRCALGKLSQSSVKDPSRIKSS